MITIEIKCRHCDGRLFYTVENKGVINVKVDLCPKCMNEQCKDAYWRGREHELAGPPETSDELQEQKPENVNNEET